MHEIKEEPSLSAADTQRIYEGLLAADPQGQPRRFAPLVLALRDSEARLMGGVFAATSWNWLSIDALWIDESLRGRGYGQALLLEAEAVARKRGCTHARLDTFDFQARGFYERFGYTLYAQLDGFPAGHTQFHLRKVLSPSS